MIKFLDKKTILLFHEDQIKNYGGKPGVRDHDLLESALSQPQDSFGGEYVHDNIYKMAAVYGFHICSNHPFFDCNKRTALVAIYTFLFVNGYRLKADKKILYAVIMDLANGKLSKDELSKFLDKDTKKKIW